MTYLWYLAEAEELFAKYGFGYGCDRSNGSGYGDGYAGGYGYGFAKYGDGYGDGYGFDYEELL